MDILQDIFLSTVQKSHRLKRFEKAVKINKYFSSFLPDFRLVKEKN